MIVFDLACARNHVFEGWFASAGDFESQSARGLLRCPVCDESNVVKRLSAVSLRIPSDARPAEAVQPDAPAPPPEVEALRREVLSRMREVVRNTENVGDRFAEEARRIHYNEVPRRNIRGQASPDEADALREEGIEFHSLPSVLIDEVH